MYTPCKDTEFAPAVAVVDRCQAPAEHLAPYCILNDRHL